MDKICLFLTAKRENPDFLIYIQKKSFQMQKEILFLESKADFCNVKITD